ncbi:hypothetical protein DY023_01075 [Microbacterium bovistercoris]|uniref:Glycoside hydrolase family 5 C-terminal domain-containing protein n=1 Tax=Microbacterium bovistercoris TaxID=2293570 RepID=A0A371NY02_9MICO|nr:hypothetical protein [Microbacterium bovistercoris]REJ08358.1 hypothetical protein DY023_01075 [Microbacterium bovistercoris]
MRTRRTWVPAQGGDWNQDDFVVNYEAAISAYPTANRMPVIVGEWGVPNSRTPGNAALVAAQVDAMERFASGWALFYFCASDGGGYCAMGADRQAAPGNEPAYGPYARAIAGTPNAEHFDAATGQYSATYTAAAGRSEIWVPSSVYVPLPTCRSPEARRTTTRRSRHWASRRSPDRR